MLIFILVLVPIVRWNTVSQPDCQELQGWIEILAIRIVVWTWSLKRSIQTKYINLLVFELYILQNGVYQKNLVLKALLNNCYYI